MSELLNALEDERFPKQSSHPFSDSSPDPSSQRLNRTVLIAEDNEIDRELYRRYLLRNSEQTYQVLEAVTGKEALDFCRLQPDVVLLDYRLPDFEGLEFLKALQAQSGHLSPPVIVITGQGNESIAVQLMKAGAEDYLIKGRLSSDELQFAVESAIEKAQLQRKIRQIEAERQQNLERERIINRIAQQVHRSLDLDDILQTTVQEVRQFLHTDRVLIFSFEPELEWGAVVAEAVVSPWDSVLSNTFHDPCFHRGYAEGYRQGRVMAAADIRTIGLEPCHLEFLESLQVRANLVVPILQKETLWGLLIAQNCAAPREWKPADVDLLKQLATQVGTAIQQANAYAKMAEWNNRLIEVNEALKVTLKELQTTEEELRQQHEQLAHEQQRYQDLFNFAPDGYVVTNSNGQIQEANQAIVDLLAVEPQFLLNQPLACYLASAEDQQAFFIQLNQPHCFQQVQSLELQLRSQQGRTFPAGITITGIYSNGQLTGLRWLIRDITERKQAEAEREHLLQQEQAARTAAERANRLKDEFLAVLSHELRSPLNPILGWVKLLQSHQLAPEKTTVALETIERNAKLQAQLIEDLLDISRIMGGKLTLNAAPVDLATVLSAALETVRLAAIAKSIQLDLAILPSENNAATHLAANRVFGDATRLQQVFWNLLSNAIKFTPNGGRVTVKLEQVAAQNGEMGSRDTRRSATYPSSTSTPLHSSAPPLIPPFTQVTITDTGKGIAPEFLPFVFEYFRQEDASTTRQFGGLGLGMSIARQMVEMHGGTIAAASPGEGQGATFTVCLPLIRSQGDGKLRRWRENNSSTPPTSPNPASPYPSTHPLAGVRVLIVDDEPDTREFLAFLLQDEGATVTEATCAADVLQTMEQFSPDVIVSDIGMPEIDGYMLMQRLRTSQQTRSIPAIALTAYASKSDQQQAIAAGFQRHATKPIDPGKMIALIQELVQPQ
ncbi:response regulator [Leptolyngbya sp. FACHB-711]|uniref:response regulator n=1 Tax=unclassified Leptolyngbya TaxID=2650499 RepID=UPI0016882AA0|nr:response regulator [Cyanobacteria bacterium FACHB-502]MBD2022931.1 response regulator [Leptolyngbya sp. FACHB-711]